MDKMKQFGIYALCVILFFIFSNIMINIAIKSSYKPMDTYTTLSDETQLQITKAKSTYVNGYVGGNITNISSNTLENKYIKIDIYSERDVLLGTKYVKIDKLEANKTIDFEMGFRFTDTHYAKIKVTDQIEENATQDSFKSDHMSGIALITAVICLCYF